MLVTLEYLEREHMKYIILCGGTYEDWEYPKHMAVVNGEPIVARTIRLLRENGIEDIAISSTNLDFLRFDVPVLSHHNPYTCPVGADADTPWLDAFYPMTEPVCYIFGDVVFSPGAIKTIVETDTDSIEFFASAKPLPKAIKDTNKFDKQGLFKRQPIAWELWQVIKGTPLNKVDYTNYTVINDYTCDIDEPEDIAYFDRILKGEKI